MTQNIILTGFMGTGKTTIGRLLATRLAYEFVDTDVFIEEKSNMTIQAIFSELGEEAFRQMERDVAAELGAKNRLVVSTGGRMMLDPANAQSLGNSGHVFCLTASPKEILRRVTNDPKRIERPLLNVPNPQQKILELLEERREKYGRFPQVDTQNKTPDQIMQEIIGQLE